MLNKLRREKNWLLPVLTFGIFFLIVMSAGCIDNVEYLTIDHVSDTPPVKGEIIPFTDEDLLLYPAMEDIPHRVSISDSPFQHLFVTSHLTKADAHAILAKYGEPFGKVLEWNHSYYRVRHLVS